MKASRKLKFAFLALLLLLFCWQVVQAPWFLAIKQIEILELNTLSPWQVEQLAGVSRGMSLLKIDLGQIKSRLEADKRILSARVYRRLPSTLVIEIDENVGVAAIPYFSNWLVVDQEGRVLAVTAQFASLNLPVVTGLMQVSPTVGDKIQDERGWSAAAACLQAMPEALQHEISEINISNPESVILYSRDPLRIVVGDCKNLETKFAALAAMLDKVREDQQDQLLTGRLDVSSGKAVFSEGR
ncbi:MAG: cell division protein FtsQ/DivIB [Bacillota bacterium]